MEYADIESGANTANANANASADYHVRALLCRDNRHIIYLCARLLRMCWFVFACMDAWIAFESKLRIVVCMCTYTCAYICPTTCMFLTKRRVFTCACARVRLRARALQAMPDDDGTVEYADVAYDNGNEVPEYAAMAPTSTSVAHAKGKVKRAANPLYERNTNQGERVQDCDHHSWVFRAT